MQPETLDLLDQLFPKTTNLNPDIIKNSILENLIIGGYLEELKTIWENGYTIPDKIFELSIKNGHLHILKWAINLDYKDDIETIFYKKKSRKLQYICNEAASLKQFHIVKWVGQEFENMGIKYNYLDTLTWAIWNYPPDNKKFCIQSAINGDLDFLEFMYTNNRFEIQNNVCKLAAIHGHLHILIWAIDNKFKCDDDVYIYAVLNEHDHIKIWMDSNNKIKTPDLKYYLEELLKISGGDYYCGYKDLYKIGLSEKNIEVLKRICNGFNS
jgi:hypothetical protein